MYSNSNKRTDVYWVARTRWILNCDFNVHLLMSKRIPLQGVTSVLNMETSQYLEILQFKGTTRVMEFKRPYPTVLDRPSNVSAFFSVSLPPSHFQSTLRYFNWYITYRYRMQLYAIGVYAFVNETRSSFCTSKRRGSNFLVCKDTLSNQRANYSSLLLSDPSTWRAHLTENPNLRWSHALRRITIQISRNARSPSNERVLSSGSVDSWEN